MGARHCSHTYSSKHIAILFNEKDGDEPVHEVAELFVCGLDRQVVQVQPLGAEVCHMRGNEIRKPLELLPQDLFTKTHTHLHSHLPIALRYISAKPHA